MRTRSRPPLPVRRISGPVELLQAVPYLLGFHPRDSLVLVGLRDTELVVTARLDLADALLPGAVEHTASALGRGGSTAVIAAVYTEAAAGFPGPEFVLDLTAQVEAAGCRLHDALLVRRGRWRSLLCGSAKCCPPEGSELPAAASAFAAQATYDGVVALPDRAAVAALLEPRPLDERRALASAITTELRSARAEPAGGRERRLRSVKRLLFAAARASGHPRGRPELPDDQVVRFGVALRDVALRDAIWLAVDDRRLDGRPLWRELARRLPPPYDAPPLLLYGWASWRAGDGTQAGMAAERALASDPDYTAAHLLMAAVTSGMSPQRTPRLRRPA